MKIARCTEDKFYKDFYALIIELECGNKYNNNNPQHIAWLKKKMSNSFSDYGSVLAAYNEDVPLGFIWYQHDTGLQDVSFSGKYAKMLAFGVFDDYQNKGIGTALLKEACTIIKMNGGECFYTDTYQENTEAMVYYLKRDFKLIANIPGLNGINDAPQILLYKIL